MLIQFLICTFDLTGGYRQYQWTDSRYRNLVGVMANPLWH